MLWWGTQWPRWLPPLERLENYHPQFFKNSTSQASEPMKPKQKSMSVRIYFVVFNFFIFAARMSLRTQNIFFAWIKRNTNSDLTNTATKRKANARITNKTKEKKRKFYKTVEVRRREESQQSKRWKIKDPIQTNKVNQTKRKPSKNRCTHMHSCISNTYTSHTCMWFSNVKSGEEFPIWKWLLPWNAWEPFYERNFNESTEPNRQRCVSMCVCWAEVETPNNEQKQQQQQKYMCAAATACRGNSSDWNKKSLGAVRCVYIWHLHICKSTSWCTHECKKFERTSVPIDEMVWFRQMKENK